MFKMGLHDPWQFDSRPLKVRNRPDLFPCKWCGTYYWKALDDGYNFSLDLISIRGLHTKLWAPQSRGSPGTNEIWVLVPWPGT
jgi:hypothetical protein